MLPLSTRLSPVEWIQKPKSGGQQENAYKVVLQFTIGAKQLSHERLNSSLDEMIKAGDDTMAMELGSKDGTSRIALIPFKGSTLKKSLEANPPAEYDPSTSRRGRLDAPDAESPLTNPNPPPSKPAKKKGKTP
jgi:hypothetical protein